MKLKFNTYGDFYLTQINDSTNRNITVLGTNFNEFFNLLNIPVGNYKFYLTNGNYIDVTLYDAGGYRKFNCSFKYANGTSTLGGMAAFLARYWLSLGLVDDTGYGCRTYLLTLDPSPVVGQQVSVQVWNPQTDWDLWIAGSSFETFPGSSSNVGGGTGSFDTTSDDIAIPGLPTLSAVTAGFITLFAPSISQLNSLASYMWSSSFDLDTFKKLFADPMDAIIGLSIVPVAVPVSGSASVKIGFIDTGVSMNLASSQYATINCGTLTPAEYFGSALDYSPYTKFSIHLPYIGTRELNTDDIMGKTIEVVYNIDILSGACTAMIKCGGSVLYEFSGACAVSIPVTGQNWTQLLTSCIQLAGAGIAVAATGGSAAGLLPSTANAVMAMKPNIQRTGAVSGSAGMLGVQQPYLIWELPRQSLARNYNKFVGYPSNITALLSTLSGYTQIENVHLENIPATQSELAEIETLLKEGVII